jgi:hypothetical protein
MGLSFGSLAIRSSLLLSAAASSFGLLELENVLHFEIFHFHHGAIHRFPSVDAIS